TAINALATSFTRDWYEHYLNPGSTPEQSLAAVRWATVGFSVLMIVVASATSYVVIVHPDVRIIPIVLGIYGYTYGSVLGIFFAGMLTKTRGNNPGNFIAMTAGSNMVKYFIEVTKMRSQIFGCDNYSLQQRARLLVCAYS